MAKIYITTWKGRSAPVKVLHSSLEQAGQYRGKKQASNQLSYLRQKIKTEWVEVPSQIYIYFLGLLGNKKGLQRKLTSVTREASRAFLKEIKAKKTSKKSMNPSSTKKS